MPGGPDGELDEDEFRPVDRYCRPEIEPRHRPRDDDGDRDRRGRYSGRDLRGGVSRWLDSRRKE
jgi:hypothetical protein